MSSGNGEELLSIRLKAVFDAIPDTCNRMRFIDVGSDHGHLTCYALKYGGFFDSVSTDIHKDPSEKTREFLEENDLASRSTVLCTDGLDGVQLKEDDVIVMAGLGGNNIMDILRRASESTSEDILKTVTFVLQPQKTIEDLREYVFDNGFDIKDEIVCLDREIYYCILVVKFDGTKRSMSLVEKYYGPVLLNKPVDDLLGGYYELLDNRYVLRARGDEETRRMLDMKGIKYDC